MGINLDRPAVVRHEIRGQVNAIILLARILGDAETEQSIVGAARQITEALDHHKANESRSPHP